MEEGDLVYVEYDVWILPEEDDGEPTLFNTTSEEKAKEEEIFDEDSYYGPRPIVIGEGDLLEGFEEALKEAEVGEEDSVEVPPEKGIGQRDAEKIEIYSRRKLERQDVDLVPGNEVQLDNRRGTILQVTSGRVRVDFNHPLAGKTLKYDFKVKEKLEDDEDIVRAFLLKDYRDVDFEIEIDGDRLDITLAEDCKYDQNWFVGKYRVIGDLRKNLDFKTIRFIEEYTQEEEEEEPEEESEGEETEGSETEEVEEEAEEEPEESEEEDEEPKDEE